MTCSVCKDRGYIITDIISGNTEPCHCNKEGKAIGALSADGELVFYGDTGVEQGPVSFSEPAVGMMVRMTTEGMNTPSYHWYSKGQLVTICDVKLVDPIQEKYINSLGITHKLIVVDNGVRKQLVYFPNECEIF